MTALTVAITILGKMYEWLRRLVCLNMECMTFQISNRFAKELEVRTGYKREL